jgi:hypothetical protein
MPQNNTLDKACRKGCGIEEPKSNDRVVEQPFGDPPYFRILPRTCSKYPFLSEHKKSPL